jgi:hypothetical protein
LIGSDIAKAHATGERPRLLHYEANDARLARLDDGACQQATERREERPFLRHVSPQNLVAARLACGSLMVNKVDHLLGAMSINVDLRLSSR